MPAATQAVLLPRKLTQRRQARATVLQGSAWAQPIAPRPVFPRTGPHASPYPPASGPRSTSWVVRSGLTAVLRSLHRQTPTVTPARHAVGPLFAETTRGVHFHQGLPGTKQKQHMGTSSQKQKL